MKMKMMMKMTAISIFMLLVSCVVSANVIHGVDVNVDSASPPSAAVRLELIHRDSPKLHREKDETQSAHHHDQRQRWKELHRRDSLRHHSLLYSRRRRDQEEKESDSFEMPMNSGADYRNGEYFVHVNVGTPAQKVTLVADTASDLTWVNCKHGCGRNCSISRGKLGSKRAFRADHSSTFQAIPCSSQFCKSDLSDLFSLRRCPTPFTPCSYDYRYMEGSAAIGFFANETISVGLTNGKKGKLENVLIGCTKSVENVGGVRGADGILGLGYGNYTFTTNAAAEFGGKFSYCLVDHLSHENVSNYLIFGDNNGSKNTEGCSKRYTKLVLGGTLRAFYGLNVLGISIGGTLLKIPSFIWDENRGGGTILDSGSSLSYLALPAYESVMDALEKSLSKYERFPVDQEGPFEYCFNSTGFDEALAPRLAIHFQDGARFEPPVKSYIIDVADQEKCIGFVPVTWPANSIIGNIMQQNHLWEFDLVGRTLGFAPSSCT